MRHWFVATTKDQGELRAAQELRAQGYLIYLPKIYRRHQDGRKVDATCGLRFTGYIFVLFDAAAEEHGPISNTRGIDELLITSAGNPIPLPTGVIETLRQIEDEEFARASSRKKPVARKDLVPGDMVQLAGDRGHPAFGQRGHYLGSEKGWASVLSGIAVWKVPEVDLKKIEPPERKMA